MHSSNSPPGFLAFGICQTNARKLNVTHTHTHTVTNASAFGNEDPVKFKSVEFNCFLLCASRSVHSYWNQDMSFPKDICFRLRLKRCGRSTGIVKSISVQVQICCDSHTSRLVYQPYLLYRAQSRDRKAHFSSVQQEASISESTIT